MSGSSVSSSVQRPQPVGGDHACRSPAPRGWTGSGRRCSGRPRRRARGSVSAGSSHVPSLHGMVSVTATLVRGLARGRVDGHGHSLLYRQGNRKQVPLLRLALARWRPPCADTMPAGDGQPEPRRRAAGPDDAGGRRRAARVGSNASVPRASRPAGPSPSSATCTVTVPGPSAAAVTTTLVPGGLWPSALPSRFTNTCSSRSWSAQTAGSPVAPQADPLTVAAPRPGGSTATAASRTSGMSHQSC